MKKLLLIDGNAILHRAYHAYPVLTNSKGEIVNAVYGFFTMLLMMLREQKPDYLAVCFDRSAPTIRQSMFAGYHKDRPKPDEEFISQIDMVHELLEKMKAQVFEQDGYEGDDLIGTITAKVQRTENGRLKTDSGKSEKTKGDKDEFSVASVSSAIRPPSSVICPPETIIVTGDRDMLQLVNDHTKVLMPITGISKTMLFDEAAVKEKYGIHPGQFVDYKALIGDQSDGYPGVTGIGSKTASSLIKEYGSFENLYLHVGDLPEKTGLKLATDAEQAVLAKKLATIITDVPVRFSLEKCACKDFDIETLRKEFEEYGFKSLLVRLDALFGNQEEVPVQKKDKNDRKKKSDGQLELL